MNRTKKRNWAPLVMSILLVGLIGFLSLLRLQREGIWEYTTVNLDMAIAISFEGWVITKSSLPGLIATSAIHLMPV
jgi:hypothetical protein